MATTSSQPSSDITLRLRLPPLMLVPALVTRMSMRPWRFSMSAAVRTTAALSETSSNVPSASPTAFSCFSASRVVFSVLPEITTRAPALASSSAPARPMPDPPPVIQATLPLSVLLCAKEHLRLLLAEARGLAPALGQHLDAPLHRRALEQLVAPALHVRELLDVHALALGRAQPRHGRHVGDRVLVASQVLRPLQLLVEDAVQAVGLVLVPVHGVLDLLRRVAEEVVRLAEHRADMAHLRHHPLHHLPALAQVLRQEFACLRGEVEQHRARLGERERLAARAVRVDHRRDLVVRRHLEE